MDYIGFNGSATSFNLLADLRFKDADGSHYVGFQSPSTVGTNLVWTLPAADGSANRVLKTDGSGNLSFAEITNAYVASNAAIAGTKISPDFGSQNIATTGTAATGALSVTGNLTVSGTVDGVDIATRDTLFGGLTASSGVLTDGVSATTQTASDNTTKVATTAYVTTAVNNLINGAPAALDTLNELAAAMNDDAAFSTTVTNNLATKLALAGGQMTGNITFSGSQTVDGRDLSVDGAKLDGGIMLADGDKGDITVSNSGATFTIDTGAITAAKIADSNVVTAKIADSAVTGAKIVNNAVTSAKIADNNVTTSEIADDAVTSAKIADGTIIAGNLADEAVQTLKIADNSVTSAKITNGTILNIDVNASAAIAGTKISPDFGSQAISTTGTLGCGDITISDATPAINFTDTTISNDADFRIRLNGGFLKITDTTNSADRFQIHSTASAGTISVFGNLDVSSGVDVTGNITVTGTVDGVDIATRDTLFGALTSSSGVLINGVTAATQTSSDSTQKVATTAFTQSAISNATITGSQISTNAIDTTNIADSAVTSAKIANGTITGADIGTNTITATNIGNSAVDTAELSDAAVTTAKIADDAVDADKLASNSVVSASIVDGTIVNADINASAAIAGTKISPAFGSQAISTTGTLGCGDITSGAIGCGDITITDVSPALNFVDSDGSQNYQIRLNSGILKFKDTTNGAERIQINSDGHVDVLGNLDVGSGLDVTGAITATGNLTITNSFPKIDLVKDSTSYQINNENGVFNIRQNDTINKIQINTDGHVDITAHLDAEGGIDVTGHATVSQSLTVTGTTSLGETLNITGNDPNITFVDSNNNPDFKIFGNGGTLNFVDSTNSANRLVINSDGHVDIPGNLDCGAGLDVTGNITVSGTVDGVDIATLNSTVSGKLSNIVEDTSPQLGGDLDMNSKFISSGILGIKNTGSQSEVRLYCEASNAHYAAVQAPAHSVFSGNVTLTLPAAAGNQSLVGTTETQTLTNKTLTSAVLNTSVSGSAILDEDNMASNSATQLATQQSIKAYVDANAGGGGGSPGGSNTQVQFNNSGSFGGSSNLTFDGTNLTVGGTVSGTSSASGTAGFRKITASTSAPTSSDGADGDVWIKYTA